MHPRVRLICPPPLSFPAYGNHVTVIDSFQRYLSCYLFPGVDEMDYLRFWVCDSDSCSQAAQHLLMYVPGCITLQAALVLYPSLHLCMRSSSNFSSRPFGWQVLSQLQYVRRLSRSIQSPRRNLLQEASVSAVSSCSQYTPCGISSGVLLLAWFCSLAQLGLFGTTMTRACRHRGSSEPTRSLRSHIESSEIRDGHAESFR